MNFTVAVKKSDAVVGHSLKGKTGWLAKTISFFLRGTMKSLAKLKLLGKQGALAMGKDSKYLVDSILLGM